MGETPSSVPTDQGHDRACFQTRGLTRVFGEGTTQVRALRGVDLTIPSGEVVVLLGASGSGKSTLLNILGGLDRATDGVFEFRGRDMTTITDTALTRFRRDHVGFVFQFYNLMPTLTAAQNVELPLLLTKLSGKQRKERVATALDIVGLADRKGHRPRQLSGGQQQRVAIARAIVADPKVLLCDEPTGDLDRVSADEILETLQLLNKELGKTIVMVTHDPSAAKYAQRELHLDKGRFIEQVQESV